MNSPLMQSGLRSLRYMAICVLVLSSFAGAIEQAATAASYEFQEGQRLLKEGTYSTLFFGKGAIDCFSSAYSAEPTLGDAIARELLEYVKQLNPKKYPGGIFKEILKFSPAKLTSVLAIAEESLAKAELSLAETVFDEIMHSSVPDSHERIADLLFKYASDAYNVDNLDNATTILNILKSVDSSEKTASAIQEFILAEGMAALDVDTPRIALAILKDVLYFGDTEKVETEIENEIIGYVAAKTERGEIAAAISASDAYAFYFPERFNNNPEAQVHFANLMQSYLMQNEVSTYRQYEIFRTVLSSLCFSDTGFMFKEALEAAQSTQDIFSDVREANESILFFVGYKGFTGYGGIALTPNTLMYCNDDMMTAKRIPYTDIESFSLRYEDEWISYVNGNQELRISLSRVPQEGILRFQNALIFFVKTHREGQQEDIALDTTEHEEKILAGSFWEKWGDTIITGVTAGIAGAIIANNLMEDNPTDNSVPMVPVNTAQILMTNSPPSNTSGLSKARGVVPNIPGSLRSAGQGAANKQISQRSAKKQPLLNRTLPGKLMASTSSKVNTGDKGSGTAQSSVKATVKEVAPKRGRTPSKGISKVPAGYSRILASVLGPPPTPEKGAWAAHHIIPATFLDHRAIIKTNIDINTRANGLYLPTRPGIDPILPLHRGNHPAYSAAIRSALDAIPESADVETTASMVANIMKSFGAALRKGKPLYGDGAQW